MGRPDYFDRYDTWAFERSDDGVLVMRIHTDGGPANYGSKMHSEWAPAFGDVARDLDNRVVVVTGTGDSFIDKHGTWLEPLDTPSQFEVVSYRHMLMFQNILAIDVPVIGVANGAVNHHAELLVLSDLVLAADTTVFGDGHFPAGEPAADGGHIFWPELLGQTRAKYFLYTGHKITAHQARDIGFVNEVWPLDQLMGRAMELAHQIATYADLSLRFHRRAMVDRWRQLFRENMGAGFGMALENLAHLDREFNVWTGSHEGSGDFAKLQRPMAKQPGTLYGYGE